MGDWLNSSCRSPLCQDRSARGAVSRSLPGLFERLMAPLSANNGAANLGGALRPGGHSFSKVRFFDAHQAICGMVRPETVEQAAVAGPVAIAIAWLLRQHSRNLPGRPVCLDYIRAMEQGRRQGGGKRLRGLRAVKIRWDRVRPAPSRRRCW